MQAGGLAVEDGVAAGGVERATRVLIVVTEGTVTYPPWGIFDCGTFQCADRPSWTDRPTVGYPYQPGWGVWHHLS